VAGWPAASSSQPFTQEGEWGEGVVVGAQLENTSRPDEGLHYTDEGLLYLHCLRQAPVDICLQ
jgi:hypothetical protein